MNHVAALPIRQTPAMGVSAKSAVVSKAVVRAAQELGMRQLELAAVLGISSASTSRLMVGQFLLPEHGKPFELALLLIRAFRGLNGILPMETASAWMRTENLALGGIPAQLIGTATGLVNTVAYLDAARARI